MLQHALAELTWMDYREGRTVLLKARGKHKLSCKAEHIKASRREIYNYPVVTFVNYWSVCCWCCTCDMTQKLEKYLWISIELELGPGQESRSPLIHQVHIYWTGSRSLPNEKLTLHRTKGRRVTCQQMNKLNWVELKEVRSANIETLAVT